MWPFQHHASSTRDPGVHRLADVAAYARCFEQWSEAAHRELVSTYQLGRVVPGRTRASCPPAVPVPMLRIIVRPGQSIDFADPVSGFAGHGVPPGAESVLTLWADDLVSISHGHDWMFVIDAKRPLERAWLDLLAPPHGATYGAREAVVSASYDGPVPAGRFRFADVDALTYTTRVRVIDRRAQVRRAPASRRA
jgi:hypothetical protein